MGNALESSTNNSYSYKIELGTLSCIRVSKPASATNEIGEVIEKQNVRYVINDVYCILTLTKTRPHGNNNKRGQKFTIEIWEIGATTRIEVQIAEGGHVVVTSALATCAIGGLYSFQGWIDAKLGKKKVTDLTARQNLITRSTEDGGIIETCLLSLAGTHFNPKKRTFVVLQLNKKGRDQSAYMITVAHYFITIGRRDIGLSLVAQIHGEEGLKLEGPIQHPGTALYQVMEQSRRSGRWIPKACPHCADGYEQKQSSQPKKKSESNSEEDSNKAVALATLTMLKHSEAVLSNSGVTIGNGNGSMLFNSPKMEIYLGGKST